MELSDKPGKVPKPIEPELVDRSKYELTLAEFPIFLLSKKGIKNIKSIDYEDTITGKDGEVVKRKWTVSADSKLGFGTASTFETFYDLFQLWKEAGFNSQYIHFGSIYNLIKRRGMKPTNKAYDRIKRDLSCLTSIKIEAKNAFWDNELKAYVDEGFHLFDRYRLYKETPDGQGSLPFGWIKASDVLYGSIFKNSLLITNFDREFFYNLTPIEQRLALYLSKIFRSQSMHKRELLEFASQIPIQAKLSKHVKEIVKKACTGLQEKGFSLLASFDFQKTADKKTEYIIFKRKGKAPKPKFPIKQKQPKLLPASPNAPEEIEYLTEEILKFCGDKKSLNFYKKVARLVPRTIVFRALHEAKVSDDLNETKKSKAAHFTYLIKKYAKERGIKL